MGKLFRSQNMNACRRLILTEPEGTKERDRLSLRWSDSTEQGESQTIQNVLFHSNTILLESVKLHNFST